VTSAVTRRARAGAPDTVFDSAISGTQISAHGIIWLAAAYRSVPQAGTGGYGTRPRVWRKRLRATTGVANRRAPEARDACGNGRQRAPRKDTRDHRDHGRDAGGTTHSDWSSAPEEKKSVGRQQSAATRHDATDNAPGTRTRKVSRALGQSTRPSTPRSLSPRIPKEAGAVGRPTRVAVATSGKKMT
jgi:hypothetical protein